jgi:hypothetical protein
MSKKSARDAGTFLIKARVNGCAIRAPVQHRMPRKAMSIMTRGGRVRASSFRVREPRRESAAHSTDGRRATMTRRFAAC